MAGAARTRFDPYAVLKALDRHRVNAQRGKLAHDIMRSGMNDHEVRCFRFRDLARRS